MVGEGPLGGVRVRLMIRTAVSWNDLVHARATSERPGAPVCMTCGRYVDYNGIVEGHPGESTRARYLVRHHGAEEACWFDMGSTNWDYADVEQMARRKNWFDPTKVGDTGGVGVRLASVGEHDGGEPSKIISMPSGGGPSPMRR